MKQERRTIQEKEETKQEWEGRKRKLSKGRI